MTELHSPVTHECLEIVGSVLACRRCGRSGGEADRSTGSAARDIRPRTRGPKRSPWRQKSAKSLPADGSAIGVGAAEDHEHLVHGPERGRDIDSRFTPLVSPPVAGKRQRGSA